MLIGEIATRTGTKVATVRFYEQIGLLHAPLRTPSGRRTYGMPDLRRLSFIRHARSLGFSIDAIRTLLELHDRPELPCDQANEIARAQVSAVETKIDQLIRLLGELRRVSERCAGGPAADCRVIEALADRSLCEDAHAASTPSFLPG